MRVSTTSSALLLLPTLVVLIALLALPPAAPFLADMAPTAAADEKRSGDGNKKKKEEEEGVEPGEDLGDKHVPFAKRVNRALEIGVNWLQAKPDLFVMPETYEDNVRAAHWGLIMGDIFYSGKKEGKAYRHPAGPTALALYTLLKCGVKPSNHLIKKGFNWLREVHKLTDEAETNKWDAMAPKDKTRHWNHTIAGSSYELSVMILALTAKSDKYKKSSASSKARKLGKLKIKDKFDRVWLQQLVTALIHRRGQPAQQTLDLDATTIKKLANPLKYDDMPFPMPEGLPPQEERLGWRYNTPNINLVKWRKKGKSKSKDGWQRQGNKGVRGNQDLSSTQLACLALYSAQRFGVKIPHQVWFDILDFTLQHQVAKGPEHERHSPGYRAGGYAAPKDAARGFVYMKGSTHKHEGKETGSMTACGIGNLLLCKAAIHRNTWDKSYKEARKKWLDQKYTSKVEKGIWDGLAWLDRNWSSFENRGGGNYHIYYLYCLERAMDILGKRLVGKHLWYPEGAKQILARTQTLKVRVPQKRGAARTMDGGFWMTNSTHQPKDVLDTCFALLYLKRATKGLVPGGVITGGDEGGPQDNR